MAPAMAEDAALGYDGRAMTQNAAVAQVSSSAGPAVPPTSATEPTLDRTTALLIQLRDAVRSTMTQAEPGPPVDRPSGDPTPAPQPTGPSSGADWIVLMPPAPAKPPAAPMPAPRRRWPPDWLLDFLHLIDPILNGWDAIRRLDLRGGVRRAVSALYVDARDLSVLSAFGLGRAREAAPHGQPQQFHHHSAPPQQAASSLPAEMPDPADVQAVIAAIISERAPASMSKGSDQLPERLDALAALLADPPPAGDFHTLDLLYTCWPKTTIRSNSRALLAVAYNLSCMFGLPGKLPMAASKAWRMLDPDLYEGDLAVALKDIAAFIFGWQREQKTFLILEFGEVELIEYLFEALHPGRHQSELETVMNFKVLSNRRMGLLRRIPGRARKLVQPLLPERRDEALVLLAHFKALLDRLAQPPGFPPILDTAAKMAEEVEKLMKQTAAAGAPALPGGAPPGGGQALGRIG